MNFLRVVVAVDPATSTTPEEDYAIQLLHFAVAKLFPETFSNPILKNNNNNNYTFNLSN